MLQSSCKIAAKGAQISVRGFPTDGWHATAVPSTVVAALVADKTFPDPYFGDNLRSIPGTSYPIGKMFSVLPMPKDSPFRCSWWYRTEFRPPQMSDWQHVWLHFDGINNRANIWLNGHEVAGANEVAGAYRTYDFDITPLLAPEGMSNALAVEVFSQTEKDLGINWVDWNPTPPDKDMGLWRGVWMHATGPVEIRSPFVATHLQSAALDQADLTIITGLRNASASQIAGTLEADIEGATLKKNFALGPGEARTVRLTPEDFPELRVRNPQIWWPRQMGAPVMRPLALRVLTGDRVSDSASIRFGIREISSEIDPQGHLLFHVNGKRILIRGGGWAPDMLLRESLERLRTQFDYVRDLNLNAIRLEGPMESDEFFNQADEQGILILAGWTCCDYWQKWTAWKQRDIEIAVASERSEIERLRSHPSMLAWLNGSDRPPPAAVERPFLAALKDLDWPNPVLSSASENITPITGPTGVKMRGPYDYTPPDYWLTDKDKLGGAFGFATEIGTGAAIPVQSSLQRMLPADHIKPGDLMWNYHAGSERFSNLKHFEDAMNAIYGAPRDFDDYERKSQAMAYDSQRAMFEAYSRNKYDSTGVIDWMLNNAWPSLIWHLWDYYLQPAGGYYGVKKACELLHVMYSYDDRSVEVVNSTYQNVAGLKVTAKLYDSNLHERFSVTVPADVVADGVAKAGAFPERAFDPPSPIYFVDLRLADAFGKVLSTNFYWLSAKKNAYDKPDPNSDAFTPVKSYEDLTALNSLPSTGKLDATFGVRKEADGWRVRVKIHNSSDRLAFRLHVEITNNTESADILPLMWGDNYISLLPGETREIAAPLPSADVVAHHKEIRISGWNVEPETLALPEIQMGAVRPGASH
ncbi:MAG TPA: hypothetical protein VJO53_10145 [Candidatus Acidoferrales bacterium]|nr:hypothetical protein [Candidatus Acidoferrales bacterium]